MIKELVEATIDRSRCGMLRACDPATLRTALTLLVEGLKLEDAVLREGSSWALAELGPLAAPMVEDLTVTLHHADPSVRRKVAWVIGRIGMDAASALGALEQVAISDPDPETRQFAAWAVIQVE